MVWCSALALWATLGGKKGDLSPPHKFIPGVGFVVRGGQLASVCPICRRQGQISIIGLFTIRVGRGEFIDSGGLMARY